MNLSVPSPAQNPRPLCTIVRSGCRASELCHLGGCGSRALRLRSYARGDRLVKSGRARAWVLAVRRGLVATCSILPDGRRQILCLNLPGDVICGMAGDGYESWQEALAPSEICELDHASFPGQPYQGQVLSDLIFAVMHDRLERSAAHLALLGRFDAMERICSFLIDMTRRIGRQPNGKWCLDLPMSREDIADYLGLNPDTVGRVLKRMREERLVEFSGPTKCEFPNLERLQARVPIVFGDRDGAQARQCG